MINIGIGIGWAKALYSVANNVIANFKARVLSYPNSIFEAGPCLDATLEELNAIGLLDNASLVITPNAYTEGILYDVIPNTTLGDMTVVRATTATRVNSAGLIEVVPRNLLQRSEEFENAVWLAGGSGAFVVTTNSTTAPNGTLTADKLIAPLTNQTIRQNLATINTSFTLSVYLKTNSGTKQMRLFINDTQIESTVNVTSDWQRFTLSGTTGGTLFGSGRVGIANVDILNESSFVYIWGAQLENFATATEYFPTTTRLNIPRLDYTNSTCPSILVEPQRTNLALRSEEFSNFIWEKGTPITLVSNTTETTSPQGINNATKATANGTGLIHIRQTVFAATTLPTTNSIFVKKANNRYVGFRNGGSGTLHDVFDFDTETWTNNSGSTLSFDKLINGWYRLKSSRNNTLPNTYISITIPSNTSGNETATVSNLTLYIWGGQSELNVLNATSYIPTVASSVTRNADVISKTGISSLIGTTYTVYGEIINEGIHNSRHLVLKLPTGGNYADVVFIVQYFNGLQATANNSTSTAQFTINSGSYSIGQTLKYALRCEQNNVAFYINGVQIGVDTLCTIPAVSTLYIGNYVDLQLGSKIKSTMIFPSALTNTELAQLTTL